MLSVGSHVQIHLPGGSPSTEPVGRLVGFYVNEPRRVIVALSSGEELVAIESDVEPLDDWRATAA